MATINLSRSALMTVVVLLLLVITVVVQARPSNAWRLHFNGKADQGGVLVLELIPKDGDESHTVRVEIDDGDRENVAARKTARALRTDSPGYDIDYESGEEVQIRTRIGTDNFEIQLKESIPGLSVKLDRN